MKKYIYKLTLALAVVMMAASCETTEYNEKYFSDMGYDSDPEITEIQSLNITLTAEDYSSIATNDTNVYNAEKLGLEAELAAVATNQYFTDNITGNDYIPAFLESVYGTYLSDGSKIYVTYNVSADAPAELAYIMAGTSYTVTADDYATAWGTEDAPSYFTPSVSAESNIPDLLAAYLSAEAGDYALVTYSYSDVEPSTGGSDDNGGSGEETTYDPISEAADTDNAGNSYSIKGTVVVTTSRSYLLMDSTGYILVYIGSDPGVEVGDIVTVEGTTSSYGEVCQFGSTATIEVVGSETVTHPTPIEMSAADLDAYTTDVSVKYVKYTGTLSISGSYTNITVEGTATASPSISYAVDGLYDTALDGQLVDVYGYLNGVTSSKYVQTLATAIVAAGTELPDSGSDYDPISDAANIDNAGNTYSIKGTVVVTTSRSYLLKDSTGYILVYIGSDPGVEVGDIVTVEGTTSSYGEVCQFGSTATIEVVGSETVTHPTPIEMSAADLDAYTTDVSVKYVKYTGTLSISGSYTNITVEGTATASPSISYAVDGLYDTALDGQLVDVYGYLNGVTSSKYVQTLATAIVASGTSVSAPAKASSTVSTTTLNAVYLFNGSKWAVAENTVMLNTSDYTAMGSTYGNLSGTQPETYIPIYLNNCGDYIYAQDGDYVDVVYKYYDGSATNIKASRFYREGSDWVMEDNIEAVVGPFECMDSNWAYNPSLTISIDPSDDDMCDLFYGKMVEIVKSEYGSEYLDSYGTSEFYSGASTYYGNINWRYGYVLGYWAAAGTDVTPYYIHNNGSDALVAMYDKLQENLKEIFIKTLQALYPDAAPASGLEVLYTIQFGLYYGPTISGVNHEMVFEVVDTCEFEFVEFNVLNSTFDVYSDDNISYVISTYGEYYK